MWNRSTTALLTLPVLMMGGCAIGQSEATTHGGGEPPVPEVMAIDDLRSFSLPLDPYLLNSRNQANSEKAKRTLVEQCMSRFGFQFKYPPERAPTVIGYERRYGMSDPKSASERGYHLPPEPDPISPDLQPAALAVLRGEGQSSYSGQEVPPGGCIGEAETRISAGAPQTSNERLADSLATQSYERTLSDSRVQAAFGAWSTCMKRSGHNYADPSKAVNDPEFAGPTATPREIQVATADVSCKKEANLLNIMASVETAYQERALEDNAEALSLIKQLLAVQEKNAASILANGS